ncbi:phage baseplate assembly protein domain-containing protein [Neptunomonas antarctica]|uniref:Phage baseplate assembly protein V n=1 Tax=Neptunomonas antarctica TaxID=619304 RepID=A0A1N7MP64_9GAMM|nr:phage baseplate assembly protein [Neptunomonas antarctica]SIS87788.1 phage baseplate assembly protein V [Neptunomonas antarctica]
MRELLRQAFRKIRRISQRALLRRVSYANKIRYLQLQVEGGQALADIEHLEPFGFTSHPLPGADVIALAFNGNGSHTVALLAGDQRYRLVIEEGEAAVYNQHGDKVHIRKDRVVEIKASVQVLIDTPEVVCSGVVKAADFITHRGASADQHTHPQTASGTTEEPNL